MIHGMNCRQCRTDVRVLIHPFRDIDVSFPATVSDPWSADSVAWILYLSSPIHFHLFDSPRLR